MSEPTHNIIVMWWGLLADIPKGWKLCDGNNNTPNLLNRFLVGAGMFYTPGSTGDESNHNHSFTGTGHYHGLPPPVGISGGTGRKAILDSVPVTGTTDYETVLPPYEAVYFIKKD